MMWELRRYLKPYVKFMILAPLFMMMEVFFDLLQPTLAAHIVDNGIVSRNFSVIERTGFLMLGVALLGLVTGVLCNFFASRASQNFGADIREALFTKVQTFSFENVDTFKSGSLMTRMTSDVVQVQNLLQMGLQGLVRAPSLLVGSVVMALIINRQLGLILLGTLIVLIAVVALLIRFSTPIFAAVQGKLDAVNTRIQENLAGIRVVKAFVRTGYETGRFREVNGDYTRVSIRAARFIALNSPIVTLIMNACLVTVLLYGGNQVSFGSVKAGDLVAFVNYVVQVLSSLLMVSSLLMNVSQAKVSADRIQEVLAAQPHIRDTEAKSEWSLPGRSVKLENVSFSYNGSSDPKDLVLRGINIEAERGETVAIIGATGSGKTTLVQLIPRLYDVTSGSIQLDGQDIRELPLLELRRRIGMILQESFLFTGTIRDNIAFGKPGAARAEVEAAARIAQAHDFISKLPEGYDTMLGQKGVNLSGGQKQRLSIARALLVGPPVLIMDDSMSALDARTERRLRGALKDITAEAVTFLIAQKISSVTEADTIIVLDDGEIAGSGSHEELMQSCRVYQEIYRSQFGSEEVPYVSKPAVQSV
ncbi:ATP-binding cassette subfamily B multidrug efflux pump [Paenibacillus sp. PastF-1]|nr:ATP-binding cassette subfamily B multidrug efflux pump [Paenibacillus sp. PastF-2]MDF9852031.1 ATP-binding cassette subfamily B multidrug efflux pump [Paenibacillus sp. PastM-2]MDF9858606.1 ATP-binding cassette subfamily B multidrug efflux pump [Paenibacillus sp. PastF-1]MDH6483873.1 ATP-binding cassette subfamily B multidrug efflux pump [Paenibacillus sp. PastH-2]MDH6511241.1 ATP-binding cassette subfamily B multidrug efflux pump [Paenibacillus sp. PastM-3]